MTTNQLKKKINKKIKRWNDNSIVTLGRNAIGFPAMKNVKCQVHGKGQVTVSQSLMERVYNAGIGEDIDYVGRALSQYRPTFCGKKTVLVTTGHYF